MQIEVISLCDAATADVSGKLNVLGAFDTIWVTQLPAVYPQCALALRIRFHHIERGEHAVRVNFVDMDGNHVMPPIESVVRVAGNPEQVSAAANAILNIHALKLAKLGEYSIDLSIDGQAQASIPLFVRTRTQQAS